MKAAMKLFLRRGFTGVTMRKIAMEIGYTPGALYRYFKDKDDMFFALRTEGFDLFYREQLRARKSTSAMRRIREHATTYVDFALKHRQYYEIMFMMQAPMERIGDDKQRMRSKRSLDLLREDVQRAMDEGIVRSMPKETVVLGLWSSLHGAIALILRGRLKHHSKASDRMIANQVMEFVLENFLIPKRAAGETV